MASGQTRSVAAIVPKKTAVSGRIPTGTTIGELFSNLPDKKLWGYDGINIFEYGSKSYLSLTGGTITGNTIVLGQLNTPVLSSSSIISTSISGGTLFSGNTNLYSIFAPIGGGSGEVNTASNIGNGGAQLFKQKNVFDLQFRSLSAGTNITFITGDTITINASGGGSITVSQTTLNFGPITQIEYNTAVTISDAAIQATSRIMVALSAEATTDHSTDEIIIEDIKVSYGNVVAGVGFDIVGYCPCGTYGSYKVNYHIKY